VVVFSRNSENSGLEVDVRFALGAGELELRLASGSRSIAILGPSGAGKSTLLRVIAGVEKRAQGIVSFDGRAWLDSERGIWVPPWQRPVAWVPQDGLLFPHRNVLGNLRFGAETHKEVNEIANLLQIDHLLDRMPRRLSGGERQRVALGRALLTTSRLLLLDEPLSALDRPLRTEVREFVLGWSRRKGVTMVLVTHDESDAHLLAEETYLLSRGSLLLREDMDLQEGETQQQGTIRAQEDGRDGGLIQGTTETLA